MIQNDILQFRTLLAEAQKILIALASNADEDEIAAALALYLIISKRNKQVDIVYPHKIRVEQSHLFAIDKIKKTVSGSNNLVVSLPYKEGTIEKVSYNIENERFNLVIEPRGEGLVFDSNQVEYQYGKGDYDIIIAVGADDISGLGEIAGKMQKAFRESPIVNIDKSPANTHFGKINLLNTASACRVVSLVTKFLNIPLDTDIASNLLTGLAMTVKSIDIENAKPEDLEAAAYLIRFGAKVLRQASKVKPAVKADFFDDTGKAFPLKENSEETKTPEDWLKPKIFTTKKNATAI